MSARRRLEAGFAVWGRWMVRFRILGVALGAAVTLALGSFVPSLRTDSSNESFLHGDDEVRVAYDAFRQQFGQDERVVVLVEPGEVFTRENLERLRALHRDLEEEVPHILDVTSLVNVRNTRGEADRLVVEDLLEEWPASDAEIAAVRRRALANPLYVGNVVSADGTFTTISLRPQLYSSAGAGADDLGGFGDEEDEEGTEPPLLTEREVRASNAALREVLARHQAPDFRLFATGGELEDERLIDMLNSDSRKFVLLASLAMVGWLTLLFRRPSGVVLPMVVVLSSLVASLGVMVLLDIPLSITQQMVPVLLLTVGICNAIHLLVIVYQQLEQGSERGEAIATALGHSGLAVLMTSVTTAVGLLSFYGAEIAPISEFGVVAPLAIVLAFVYSVTLLPALLALAPLGQKAPAGAELRAALSGRLTRVGDFAVRRPWPVLAATGALLAAGAVGVAAVRPSHNALAWFPEDDPTRVATERIDRKLGGASSLELVVDTGADNGLHDPEVMNRLDAALRFAEGLEGPVRVGKTVSLLDIVKESHQALNENRPAFYAIPQERQLLAQELLLFENSGSDDLEDFTDSRLRLARLSLRLPWIDAVHYPPFAAELRAGLDEILGPGLEYQLTGLPALFGEIFSALIGSMLRSYGIALAVITPLMVLLIGNWRRGLLAMLPNLIPVYLVLALMGWMGIPIDASTLLIGCVIIGLAVDDTIHFMHKFNRYYEDCGDARQAVHETLATTGTAMLFTSLVLGSGFLVIAQGYMNNSFWFGTLAAFAALAAFVADVVLAPALMALSARRQ